MKVNAGPTRCLKCLVGPIPATTCLNTHQRVTTTRWWVLSLSQCPCQPKRPPMSHDDSLVGFIPYEIDTPAQTPTNDAHQPFPTSTPTNETIYKSQRLVVGFNNHTGSNAHQQVRMTHWWVSYLVPNIHTSPNAHQQVVVTCWWVLALFQWSCRLKSSPTSHGDSLVDPILLLLYLVVSRCNKCKM